MPWNQIKSIIKISFGTQEKSVKGAHRFQTTLSDTVEWRSEKMGKLNIAIADDNERMVNLLGTGIGGTGR